MKALMLRGGDFVLSGRDFAEVTGPQKVAQDLRCALAEPMATDRFHPGWGSTLDQFIASIANENTRTNVEAEINRVISNYAAVQRDKVEADIFSDAESRFSTDEILRQVRSVDVQIHQDSISATITIQTASGDTLVLNEAISA